MRGESPCNCERDNEGDGGRSDKLSHETLLQIKALRFMKAGFTGIVESSLLHVSMETTSDIGGRKFGYG